MEITLLTGTANPSLAARIAAQLDVPLGQSTIAHFPDGELHVELEESVRGRAVYIVQPTSAPVADHLLELLLLADASHRAGAATVSAVVPYFAYARQDRRAQGREAVAARVLADLLAAGHIQRVLALDLHTATLEGFFAVPLEHLSAVPRLIEAVRPLAGANGVVVSPDLGAVKLAERYAGALAMAVAVVHKTRLSGLEVRAQGVIGEVRGRIPIVVDDMISTAGTAAAAIECVLAAGALPEVTLVASHGLFVGPAVERLRALPIHRLVTTDSVPLPASMPLPLEVVGLDELLADAIRRLERGESLAPLLARG